MKKLLVLLLCVVMCAGSAFAAESSSDSSRRYSKALANNIRDFLVDDDWNFEFDDDKGLFTFGLNIGGKMKSVRYRVLLREDAYTVYAISPINADPEDKASLREVMEFVCRANYGLRNGNFEVDVRDGELRYKTYVDCEDGIPARSVIKNSIYVPGVAFERYAPGFLDVIFAGKSASEAVAQCEDQ